MSRHQAYRNYDYEQDLDEYDGVDYENGEEEELSPEDRGMYPFLTKTHCVLGSAIRCDHMLTAPSFFST